MKQLQWDKVPQQQVGKTLWNDESVEKEKEWVNKLQSDGVWQEMEEDFKAKQLVINLMGEISRGPILRYLIPVTFDSKAETSRIEECS
jgi:cytokinesis protein